MTQAMLPFPAITAPANCRKPRELFSHCPACQKKGWFQYSGVQHWSEVVAAACDLPVSMRLWTCEHCHSTVSEASLRR